MQLNRFDLNLLIALDALLREKNVTRAAERVFVSQPAMSAALQKLRAYFYDPLLVRVGRDMQLTPKGLSLVEPVHEVLLRVQATLATQPTFDPGSARRSFTLVVASSALALLLPQLLDRMVRDAPGVQCHVDSLNATSLSRLEYGDVDLCIAIDDPQFFGQRHWPEWLRSAAAQRRALHRRPRQRAGGRRLTPERRAAARDRTRRRRDRDAGGAWRRVPISLDVRAPPSHCSSPLHGAAFRGRERAGTPGAVLRRAAAAQGGAGPAAPRRGTRSGAVAQAARARSRARLVPPAGDRPGARALRRGVVQPARRRVKISALWSGIAPKSLAMSGLQK
jgi:DNA-binding transcriptional LysR family regulator